MSFIASFADKVYSGKDIISGGNVVSLTELGTIVRLGSIVETGLVFSEKFSILGNSVAELVNSITFVFLSVNVPPPSLALPKRNSVV
jgi:hypothetical protein